MRTSTPLSCYPVLSRRHAPGGTFPLSGRWSMGLLRTNRRLVAGVSHRITFAAAHAHVSDLARTRRSCAPSKPVLAAPGLEFRVAYLAEGAHVRFERVP